MGGNAAGRASDTGFTGGIVDSGGGFAASMPLELAPARNGLPVPVSIRYIGRGMGSAGLGWDVPISYVRREVTLSGQRPKGNPSVDGQDGVEADPQAPERVFVVLDGQRIDMVPKAGGVWVPRTGAPQMELRDEGDTWEMFDGSGRRYVFSDFIPGIDAPDGSRTRPLVGKNLFPLIQVIDAHGTVTLDILLENTPLPNGNTGVAIDLQRVRYNNDAVAASCYRDQVLLRYEIASTTPYTMTMLGDLIWVRTRIATSVEVYAHKSGMPCQDEQAPTGNYKLVRKYELQYPRRDADTQQLQLGAVVLHGQEGTTEASQSIPIATYSYGTASDNGALRYGVSAAIDFAAVTGDPLTAISAQDGSSLPAGADPAVSTGYVLKKTLLDMNGDGRPDMVFTDGSLLTAAINLPGEDGAFDFSFEQNVRDGVFPAGPLEVRSASGLPNLARDSDQVWQQAIDVNGDGRIDIVSAREVPGKWVIYLNKPTAPHVLSGFTWERHEVSIQPLLDRMQEGGLALGPRLRGWGGYLPISNRVTGRSRSEIFCAQWDPTQRDDQHPNGSWVDFSQGLGSSVCPMATAPGHGQQTFTEWELQDVNGDGYPDLVYSFATPIVLHSSQGIAGPLNRCPFPTELSPDDPYFESPFIEPGRTIECEADKTFGMDAHGSPPAIFAVLNTFGTRFPDQRPEVPLFSLPVGLTVELNALGGTGCGGVGEWASTPDGFTQTQVCGFMDVNGDGFPDWVAGQTAYLNSGVGGHGITSVAITLPGPLARQVGNEIVTESTAVLRDMNGDGIPDYVSVVDGTFPPQWTVQMGTGAGFAPAIPIVVDGGHFALSTEFESAATDDSVGKTSETEEGLYDLDGDGIPEVVVLPFTGNPIYSVLRLQQGGVPGVPQAGKLVAIANGHGGTTTITYRSAKENESFGDSHLVPFAENVVSEMMTTGLAGAGHDLAPTEYAYGRIELVYDNVAERFMPTGYGRSIELKQTSTAGGTATITDRYGPFFALQNQETAEVLFLNLARIGHVSDVNVLSGAVGADPWALLPLDLTDDARRIAQEHHDLGDRLTQETDPTLPTCPDARNAAYNACATHGFVYDSAVTMSEGAPIDLSGNNAATRVEVTEDELGRVTFEHRCGDLSRSDDDVCVTTEYAPPAGTDTLVLTAVSTRRTTDCGNTLLTQESFTYDGRTDGKVDTGFVSAMAASRLDEAGRSAGRDVGFTATPDVFGNPHLITRQRVDTHPDGSQVQVTQTTTTTYDPFGLVPTDVTTIGTGVPARTVHVHYDDATLQADRVTDPNGMVTGTVFDGFGRAKVGLVQPVGGALGAMSCTQYLGFAQGEAGPQQIRVTQLVDAVDPQAACGTAGHTSTMTLDELGRSLGTAVDLGSSYTEGLVTGAALYDVQGRVSFMPDPLPSTQNPKTAYGTTYTYNTDGTPACTIRGNGPQPANAVTNLATEVLTTCYERHFEHGREIVTVTEPDGKQRRSERSAIGRALTAKTLGPSAGGSPILERADFGYDRLGHQTSVTRYRDPAGASQPVTWTTHYDSLGAVRELDEPGSAPRFREVDDWGEVIEEHWNDGVEHAVFASYDALGRPIHREERSGTTLVADSVYDSVYDVAVSMPVNIPEDNVMGRLVKSSSSSGSTFHSYDGLGRLAAKTYTSTDPDLAGMLFDEENVLHDDGSPRTLHFHLPDNGNADEWIEYVSDSAGRITSVTSASGFRGFVREPLFQASVIDPLGRIRHAVYGTTMAFTAHYADTGRRLMDDVTVSAPPLLSREIHYGTFDVLGRETQRDEHVGSDVKTTVSTYDALGRLAASHGTTNGVARSSATFSYDPLGNRLSQSDPLTQGLNDVAVSVGSPSATPDLDRLCRVEYGRTTLQGSDCNVVYDGVGNIVTEPTTNGARHLTYFANGLVRTVSDENGNSAQFRYDGSGAVAALDVQSGNSSLERRDRRFGSLIEKRDVVDNGPIVIDTCPGCDPPPDPTGSMIIRHVPGPGGVFASRRGAGGPWVFAFGEARGNRFFTDDSGNIVQGNDYRPFGEGAPEGAAEPGTTLYSREQWNGGDALEAFGLVHLGARLYDPALGRFLSRDPLMVGHPYAFAGNDPVNYGDPTGLACGGNEGSPEPCPQTPIVGGSGGGVVAGKSKPKKPAPKPHGSPSDAPIDVLLVPSLPTPAFQAKNFPGGKFPGIPGAWDEKTGRCIAESFAACWGTPVVNGSAISPELLKLGPFGGLALFMVMDDPAIKWTRRVLLLLPVARGGWIVVRGIIGAAGDEIAAAAVDGLSDAAADLAAQTAGRSGAAAAVTREIYLQTPRQLVLLSHGDLGEGARQALAELLSEYGVKADWTPQLARFLSERGLQWGPDANAQWIAAGIGRNALFLAASEFTAENVYATSAVGLQFSPYTVYFQEVTQILDAGYVPIALKGQWWLLAPP